MVRSQLRWQRAHGEDTMLRSVRALAVAALIFPTLCGITNAAAVAPLGVAQTQTNNFTQAHYYHRHYWRDSYPRYYSGWHPCLDYWWTWVCGGGWWYPSPVLR